MNEQQVSTLEQAARHQEGLAEQLRALSPCPELERARHYVRAAADELADACLLAGLDPPGATGGEAA